MSNVVYKNISLEDAIKILVSEIMDESLKNTRFYYKNGDGVFDEIISFDLMGSRFKTANDDFSEFEWEKNESNIYIKEVVK